MTKRTFFVKAVWDDEAKVFYCQSDIIGLHVEAATVDEFEAVVLDVAVELIVANHISAADLAEKPISELIPVILWQRPEVLSAAA